MKFVRHFSVLLMVMFFNVYAAIDTVTVGTIKVAVKEQALLIPAVMAIDSGILEFMAVTKGGKTYESVLTVDCNSMDFHACLLLINSKPGTISYKGDSIKTPIVRGDTMLCNIVYNDSTGKSLTIPVFDLIRLCNPEKRAQGDSLKKKIAWIFVGSQEVDLDGSGKKVRASSLDGSLIGILINPSTEICLSEVTDNPYRGEMTGFCIDEKKAKELPKKFFLRITRKK